jgi:hypothetical protein
MKGNHNVDGRDSSENQSYQIERISFSQLAVAHDDDLLLDTNDSMKKGKKNVAFKLLSRDTRGRIETRQLALSL